MSTYRRTTNPREFPVEIVMLFEKASYEKVRFPAVGGYKSEALAFGGKMTLARWRAQMLRSTEVPRGLGTMLRTIQFKQPVREGDVWCFYIEPLSTNPTIELAKGIVGDVDAAMTESFWEQFK